MKHSRKLIKLVALMSLFFTGIATTNVANAATTEQGDDSSITQKRNAVAKLAKKQVGKRYVYGATGPFAFDCSGLVQYVYQQAGNTYLPRTTYTQVALGKKVSLKKLKKGDLLYWGSAAKPNHVGIYVGGNKFVHAATPQQGVRQQALSAYFYPAAAKRVLE
ncbi:C40 family peptidase [Lactobacillus xylocopicola]|uniref:NlpC/P60 domain-containing protein n=1 Tax=Lactobacillus xylocopicola TaxID=2976676 RepID=A0ABM8BIC7_9LACO|nr:NlpC/P60 family protein [Lactobacillus xylocopicola]BDR61043.1 hypothetical protein KIM322_13040 [Lactobacillus xylocopicola]